MPDRYLNPVYVTNYTHYTLTNDLVTLYLPETSHSIAWNRIWTPATAQISHTEHNVLLDVARENNGCVL